MSTSSRPKKWLGFEVLLRERSKPKTFERRVVEFSQISTSVMRETNAAQMLYVTIFMDHTIALVTKAIMEMAKTAKVRLP